MLDIMKYCLDRITRGAVQYKAGIILTSSVLVELKKGLDLAKLFDSCND